METTPSVPQRHLRFWSGATLAPHFNTRAINQPFSITIVWGLWLSRVRGWQRWKTFSRCPRGSTVCVGNICENCITLNIRGKKNVRNHHVKQTYTEPLWKRLGEVRTEINVPRHHRVGGLLNQLVLNSGAHAELLYLGFFFLFFLSETLDIILQTRIYKPQ